MNLISEDYLMHYGVKGMKWGVRHDPQPTGRMRRRAANQQYRQSVKAAGRRNIQAFRDNYGSREARRSANQQFRNEVSAAKQKNKEAFALSNKQKKLLKGAAIGAAVVGAGAIGMVALKSGAGKAAISKGAKYLRMGKTDAKIMKIGVQDAVNNNYYVKSGKWYANKGVSKISNGIEDTRRSIHRTIDQPLVDTKKKLRNAKNDVGKTIIRSLDSVDAKITRNKSKRVIRKAVKDENKLMKNALKDANSKYSPWPEASHVKNPTGKKREYDYGAGTGISRIGKYKKYARVRVNSNTWKNRKY